MGQLYLNNAHARLATNINNTATTIQLTDVANFPVSLATGEWFLLTLYKPTSRYGENIEVVKVTGWNGSSIVCERGHERTAVSHTAGELVESRVTAGVLQPMYNKLATIEEGATADQTATEIKTAYESNTNTNEFNDAEKTKLGGIEAGATQNATDAQLRDRATHTGTQPASTVTGLATVATSGKYSDLTNKPDLSALEEVTVYTSKAAFPATGEANKVYIAEDTGYMHRWSGTAYVQLTDQTAIWGQVSGTLADQTDLNNALAGKVDKAVGKALSTNDYTDADQSKLAGIESGATADQSKADIDALNIDADTLDGVHASAFVQNNATSTGASKTLVNGERCFVTEPTLTITLPAAPEVNTSVSIGVQAFTDTVVGRNGSNIMGLAENLIIDKENAVVTLLYVNSTEGWRIV